MSRVSKEQAQLHRAAITTASARLFREHGLKAVSVSDLMAAAGLTHGGFYGHFASKDALAAEACQEAFDEAAAKWRRRVAKADGKDARKSLIEGYLSHQSRNSAGTACPTASLASDVAREPADAPIRAAYLTGTEELLRILADVEDSGDPSVDRSRALSDLATMVGALVLSRATSGSPVSNELFAAARERLTSPQPARRRARGA
jgi:TetR/AcrR family transcriptional repressor of nem operon